MKGKGCLKLRRKTYGRLSTPVQAFFSALVFMGRFYDAFGATEAPGIGYGTTGWLDIGIPARLAAEGRDPARPASVGLLEVCAPGAATRFFGADGGNADAAKHSAEAFTAEGWWRSGDLVEASADGISAGGGLARLRVLGAWWCGCLCLVGWECNAGMFNRE